MFAEGIWENGLKIIIFLAILFDDISCTETAPFDLHHTNSPALIYWHLIRNDVVDVSSPHFPGRKRQRFWWGWHSHSVCLVSWACCHRQGLDDWTVCEQRLKRKAIQFTLNYCCLITMTYSFMSPLSIDVVNSFVLWLSVGWRLGL